MKSLSLSTRMIAASVVLAVLVAGVFAVLVYAVVTLDNAREREAATKDVRTALVGLEKLVIDLETGLRGVVLTGDARFLRPATAAGKQVDRRAGELERLVAENPTQLQRVRDLRLAINSYVGDYLEPMVNLAQENIAAVRQTLARVEAKRRTDEIRESFNELQSTEDARAAASAASATTQSRRAIVLGVAGLVASALLIVLFGLYLARSTAHPVREAATAATRLAEGDLSVRLSERGPGEVGDLTAAFNHMAEELERQRLELQTQNEKLRESERRKSELVRIVSHELRTPLASILGFTSVLLNRDTEPEEQRRYLEIIDREGRRLSDLLNDFLDAERLDEGHLLLEHELIDVSRVVQDQVRLFEGQSEKHARHGDPADAADRAWRSAPTRAGGGQPPVQRHQILARGGTVHVVAEQDNGMVRVSVRDEGLGIPEDQQERVFLKFFRGDAPASGIPGTGLGLTIARSVVEAHGGSMNFESDSGEGSVFWLELPTAAAG